MRSLRSRLGIYTLALSTLTTLTYAEDDKTINEDGKTVAEQQKTVTEGWHKTYERALAEAQELGRPLLIHFHATWCGPCRRMESTVLNTPEVIAELGHQAVAVKVDSDTRPDLVSRFGIGGLPADVFVDADQKVIARGGAWSGSAYAARIREIGDKYADVSQWRVDLAEFRESAEASLKSPTPALKGFSPVAISEKHSWKKGDDGLSWTHEGVQYRLNSLEELAKFKENTERYVPRWSGFDPLEFAEKNDVVTGSIKFAAFFRGELYLLSSEENRRRFIENPTRYAERPSETKRNAKSS